MNPQTPLDASSGAQPAADDATEISIPHAAVVMPSTTAPTSLAPAVDTTVSPQAPPSPGPRHLEAIPTLAPPTAAAPLRAAEQMANVDSSRGNDYAFPDETHITWTASEFIAHHKTPGWYMALGAGALLLAAAIYFITHDKLAAAVVLFVALVFGVSASRQPRELQYTLDGQGLTIGPKLYPYQAFRTFAVLDEGSFSSITFMPLKRFAPAVTVYYDPEDEERIIDALADHLPMQDQFHDPVDRLMRRIRF